MNLSREQIVGVLRSVIIPGHEAGSSATTRSLRQIFLAIILYGQNILPYGTK